MAAVKTSSAGSLVRGGQIDHEDPDALENQALERVDRAAKAVYAAARAAFPDQSDPLEIYTRAVVSAGGQTVHAAVLLNRAHAARLSAVLAEFQRQAAPTEDATPLSAPWSPEDPAPVSRAGIRTHSPTLRNSLIGAAAVAVMFLTGMLVEHWRIRSTGTDTVIADMQDAGAVMAATKGELVNAATAINQALSDTREGVGVLQRIMALPDRERTALTAVVTELATNPGTTSVLQLDQLFRLPVPARDQALMFAASGTPQLREELLAIQRLAAARKPGRRYSNHLVCLLDGPSATSGDVSHSCLVQVPDDWNGSDKMLRDWYLGSLRR